MKRFSRYYDLDIKLAAKQINIRMEMLVPIVRTSAIPETKDILQKQLPNVLVTECFNEQKLPFVLEVKNTEIGHLFEHILLQHILEGKLSSGFESFTVDGVTSWDWNKDKKGVFHISLNVGLNEVNIFSASIIKTNSLVDKIIATGLKN